MVPIMRWVILAILMFGWGASQLQRASLSVLVPMLQTEWGLSANQFAVVFTAFMVGLMAGYILMTVVTALLGTRWGLAVGFAGAALASVASGLVGGYVALLASRFALGFFSAALIPAAVQTVREWFPPPLRPLAIGLVLASFQVAALISPMLVTFLAQTAGWRVTLSATGLPAALAAVLCVLLVKAPPAQGAPTRLSGSGLVSVGMLAVGLCLAAPASMLLNTWLPTYLRQSLGIEMSLFTKLNVLMTAGSLGGALLSGGIACVLIYLGLSSSRTRAFLLTACGCLLPFVALAGLLKMPWVILMLSGLVMVGYFGVTTLLYTAVADTLPSRGVAIAMAVGGLAMTPSYMLLPPASGYVIEQLGYGPLFLIGGGVGALAWLVVSLPAWFIKQPDADMAVPRVAGVPPQCG